MVHSTSIVSLNSTCCREYKQMAQGQATTVRKAAIDVTKVPLAAHRQRSQLYSKEEVIRPVVQYENTAPRCTESCVHEGSTEDSPRERKLVCGKLVQKALDTHIQPLEACWIFASGERVCLLLGEQHRRVMRPQWPEEDCNSKVTIGRGNCDSGNAPPCGAFCTVYIWCVAVKLIWP